MNPERPDKNALRELLGLRPEATDAEARETYRELESFLAQKDVPRRLQSWAARQRAVAARALATSPAAAPVPAAAAAGTTKAAKPKPRPSDLPDLFDEDLADERPAQRPRRVVDGQRPDGKARPRGRQRRGLLNWRSAVLVVVLGIVVAGVLMGTPLLGSLSGTPDSAATTGAAPAPTPVPLDQARVAALLKVVQANPSDTAALFELGEMNFQAEKWQDSIDWFTKLLAVDPTDNHARTDIGTSNYNLGNYDAALVAWQEVARRDPTDAQVHFNLGFLYLNGPEQSLDEAIAEWQKVVDIDPNSQIGKTAKTHLDALKQ
jgi:tetratricopeptide (TPR) repeat protein